MQNGVAESHCLDRASSFGATMLHPVGYNRLCQQQLPRPGSREKATFHGKDGDDREARIRLYASRNSEIDKRIARGIGGASLLSVFDPLPPVRVSDVPRNDCGTVATRLRKLTGGKRPKPERG